MSDIYDELGEWLNQRKQRDAETKSRAANDERFDAINTKLDALTELISKPAADPSPPAVGGDPPPSTEEPPPVEDPPPPPAPELPVQRVTKLGVPRVYTGDDEPNEVQYVDEESGETRTRPGRRKGQPSIWQVENVEPAADPPDA